MKIIPFKDETLFSTFKGHQIDDIMEYLKTFLISYRPLLDIPTNFRFGHEIEYRQVNRHEVTEFITKNFPDWNSKVEDAISKNSIDPTLGGEISSPPLTNTRKTFEDLSIICHFLQDYKSGTAIHTGAHIHFDGAFYDETTLYLLRLLKLWTAYEDIIYRFSYGEYIYARPGVQNYAHPVGQKYHDFFNQPLVNYNGSYPYISRTADLGKLNGLNLSNLNIEKMHTIEIRCPNGTLDPIILQNNLNFFAHLLLYCMSPKFNEDLITKRFNEANFNLATNNIDIARAFELSDLIFNDPYDKLCFLKQYYKNGETSLSYSLTDNLTLK